MVQDFWKGGYKYFTIDLDDGEARMCLSPAKGDPIDLEAYGVEMYPRGKIYYVDFLKVSPQYRNSGHGSLLLTTAIKWADTAKNILVLDAIPLDTGIDSHRLIRFYLGHGFRMSGSSKNKHSMYYHNRDILKKTKRNVNKPKTIMNGG